MPPPDYSQQAREMMNQFTRVIELTDGSKIATSFVNETNIIPIIFSLLRDRDDWKQHAEMLAKELERLTEVVSEPDRVIIEEYLSLHEQKKGTTT